VKNVKLLEDIGENIHDSLSKTLLDMTAKAEKN
jgi:hypothetical protein